MGIALDGDAQVILSSGCEILDEILDIGSAWGQFTWPAFIYVVYGKGEFMNPHGNVSRLRKTPTIFILKLVVLEFGICSSLVGYAIAIALG